MGLYGDEWQMLWFSKAIQQGSYQIASGDIWNSYLNEMVVFKWIEYFFGYDGRFYYLFSFLCRFLSVGVSYWFFYKHTKSILAAVTISSLFMVSPIGIEATDWARNFDSYLGIALLLFLIDQLIKISSLTKVLFITFISIILFLINPLRSHGTVLIILGIICTRFITERFNKYRLMTLCLILSIYLFFTKIEVFGGLTTFEPFPFTLYLSSIKNLVGNMGRVLVPSFGNQPLLFGGVAILFLLWKWELFNLHSTIGKVLFAIFVLSFLYVEYQIFNAAIFAKSVYIGIFFLGWIITSIVFHIIQRQNAKLVEINTLFLLTIAFLIFPFIRQPHFQAASDHRYLVYSALAVVWIVLGVFMKKNSFISQFFIYLLLFTLIYYYSWLTHQFLSEKSVSHNYLYSTFLWNQIYQLAPDVDSDKRSNVFFLKNNFTDSSVFGDSVNFGFMFHFGLLFNISKEKNLPYLFVEDPQTIYSLLNDGKQSLRYFPTERVFRVDDSLFFKIDNGKVKKLSYPEVIYEKSAD
jgi:hypothetical protein